MWIWWVTPQTTFSMINLPSSYLRPKYYLPPLRGSLCSGSSEEGQIGPSEATNIHVFTVLCWEAGQGLNHVSIPIQLMQT